jgi:hypothetical protein
VTQVTNLKILLLCCPLRYDCHLFIFKNKTQNLIFKFASSKSTGLGFLKLNETFSNYNVTETKVIDIINFVNEEGLSSQQDQCSETKDAKLTSCLAVIMILAKNVDR